MAVFKGFVASPWHVSVLSLPGFLGLGRRNWNQEIQDLNQALWRPRVPLEPFLMTIDQAEHCSCSKRAKAIRQFEGLHNPSLVVGRKP